MKRAMKMRTVLTSGRYACLLVLVPFVAACTRGAEDASAKSQSSAAAASGLRLEVSGLRGSGLVVEHNGKALEVNEDGFVSLSSAARTYDIGVLRQPHSPMQQCTVSRGQGEIAAAGATVVRLACVTQIPRFAYTIDYNGASTSAYSVDSGSGQLHSIGFAATGRNPVAAAADSAGRFWYVLNRGSANVSAYTRDPVTGKLTEVAGSPFATGGQSGADDKGPTSITVHPNGRFVYVTNGASSHDVAVFSVDESSGVLKHVTGSPFQAGDAPFYLTLSRTGNRAYVTDRSSNRILAFQVDPNTGALAESGRVSTGVLPGVLTLHPTGRWAYVPNTGDGTLSAFSVDPKSGALVEVRPAVPVGEHPAVAVAIHPSGDYIYMRCGDAPGQPASLTAYRIDPSSGVPTRVVAPVPLPTNTSRLAMDPSGRYMFVASRGAGSSSGRGGTGTITTLRIDAKTGALTSVGVVDLQLPPHALAIDPSGHYVYATSVVGNILYSYSIDSSSGTLIPTPERAILQARSQPIAMTVLGLGQ